MSSKVPYQNVGYGLTNALPTIFQPPIVAKRAPTTADQADLGATWIYPTTNTVWTLTSIVAGSATWTQTVGSGGSGVFSSVEATTGNITADAGNFVATAGTATIHGNITSTTGNITATAGNIVATAGSISGGSLVSGLMIAATGDNGSGFATITSITNATDTTQSTGALTIKSASANNGTNAGFIKIYVGTTTAYVPYFTTVSP